MSKSVLAWLGVLFIAMGGTILWLGYKYSRPAAAVYTSDPVLDRGYKLPPPSAGDVYLKEFTLTERDGSKKGTADLAGKVNVTNFFFASCPAECKRQNAQFEIIQREYGPKGVQFLSITCDPELDTPSYLAQHARQFDIANDGQAWWFLTGDLTYIRRIAEEIYRVPLKRYTHTEKFEVRDKWGHPRGSFSWKEPASLAELKLTLDRLLAETEPPAEVVKAAEERATQIKQAEEAATEQKAEKQAEPVPAEKPAEATSPTPAAP
ncbi:SCO family protein [Anatilimnocola sp. NA78]|uniref:SCO family protein n=1 Tax=Anatilimnocola sp. NA78 TaxID=3415683 RepID=UPI003CE5B7EE